MGTVRRGLTMKLSSNSGLDPCWTRRPGRLCRVQIAWMVSVVGLVSPLATCGGRGDNVITAPSSTTVAIPLQSLRVVPQGARLQQGTEFIMEPVGSFSSNTTFQWSFGDGSSASGQRVAHVYDQLGIFSVSLEVSSGEDSASLNQDVRVRSLVGTWDGEVTGHTAFPSTHPVPITSFVLTVFTVSNPLTRSPPVGSTASVDGFWTDDAGCQVGRGVPGSSGTLIQTLDVSTRPGFDPAVVGVVFGIQRFQGNGESGFADLELIGTADGDFNNVVGTCPAGGQNCRFSMRRRRFRQSPPPLPDDLSP